MTKADLLPITETFKEWVSVIRASHGLSEVAETAVEGYAGFFCATGLGLELIEKFSASFHDYGVKGTLGDQYEIFKTEIQNVLDLLEGRNRLQELAIIKTQKNGLIRSQISYSLILDATKALLKVIRGLLSVFSFGTVANVVVAPPEEDSGPDPDKPVKIDLRRS